MHSPFRPPPLRVNADVLRRYCTDDPPNPQRILRNYHHEEPVSPQLYAQARAAAVLIGVVADDAPRLLLTRRPQSISAPGQICFPGGIREHGDEGPIATALRESEEELGIDPTAIEPLATLGRYFSHSGHEIVPILALIHPPFALQPNAAEVEEVLEVPTDTVFAPQAYRLVQHDPDQPLAHYHLSYRDVSITGPTVCLLMHLYEELAAHTIRRAD